jgi:hypothetical protein
MKNRLSSKVVIIAGKMSSRDATIPIVAFLVVTRETAESLRDLRFFTTEA